MNPIVDYLPRIVIDNACETPTFECLPYRKVFGA